MNMEKAVLITGAAKNTGLAIAEKFLSEGRTVFITSRNITSAEQRSQELSEKYRANCYALDYRPLEAKTECQRLFELIEMRGYIADTLICAHADPGFGQDTLSVELTKWENVILANVMGSYLPARTMAGKLFAEGLCGNIVFIGSTLSQTAVPGRSAYIASKGALASMTKALALDFAPLGIRVNCVSAGPIMTDRWAVLPDEIIRQKAKIIPCGKPLDTTQIANAVYFLCSAASEGISGTSLVVDGGLDCVIPGAY